jgi:hypothetical protein
MLSSDDLQRNNDASNEFLSIDTRLLILMGLDALFDEFIVSSDDFLRNIDVSNKLVSTDDRLL